MKNFNLFKTVLIALVFSIAFIGRVNADATGFTLVNRSGKDIVELHIMEDHSVEFFRNYLGVSVLRNGDSIRINCDTTSYSSYTIGVNFSDGTGYSARGFDLRNAHQIIVDSNEFIQER